MWRWLLGLLLMLSAATPVAVAQDVSVPLPDGTPLCGAEQPSPGATPIPDDGVLRIATFNVLHSETEEGDASLGQRLPLLAEAIATARADAVGAQEVTRNVTFDPTAEAPQRHGLVAQRLAAAVAERTREPWSWCWSLSNPHVPLTPDINQGGGNPLDEQAAARGNFPDEGDFSEGLAILTRFQIEQSRFRRLPPRSYEAPACVSLEPFCPPAALFDSRQVLWARVGSPHGAFDMFTTHIAHQLTPLSDTTKLLQTQQALAITEEWAIPDALPDFLVGDFNSAPDGVVIGATRDAGFADTYRAAGGPECTSPGAPGCSGGPPDGQEVYSNAATRPMSERIDYVLARPPDGCDFAVTNSERIGDRAAQVGSRWLWPSDHLGFVSEVGCRVPTAAADQSGRAGPALELPATGGSPPASAMLLLAAGSALLLILRRRAAPSPPGIAGSRAGIHPGARSVSFPGCGPACPADRRRRVTRRPARP